MGRVGVGYRNGVFVLLRKLHIREGTRGIVILTAGRKLVEFARKHRKKVQEDVRAAFLEERR
ncbi:antitoxin family protein [Thermococcus piezophilus]|uniref:Antitoxin n=1 Tax=Thermococcus piezophilus TaxID=1712654 RepID=A0A172WG84_9EURY|nr:antitoxin AF2212-like protein [Thermococcus piezophilus]ANF22359.1 hypothetical protein A7C91_03595 [Thermococcus piezophilus]